MGMGKVTKLAQIVKCKVDSFPIKNVCLPLVTNPRPPEYAGSSGAKNRVDRKLAH